MYSVGDDSDGESYADQLSPSDGYFASSSSSHVVPIVPNILVPDPTLQQTSESAAESKAREAKEETLSSNTQRSESYNYNHYHPTGPGSSRGTGRLEQRAASSTNPHQRQHDSTSTHTYSPSSRSRTIFRSYRLRGRTPSVYSDAPPAYSPLPTSLLSSTNQQSGQSRNYSTFSSTMGVTDIVENERLLGRDPESMGQPEDVEFSHPPHWTRRVRRRLPTWLSCRTIVLGLVVLIVSIGLLASTLHIFKEGDHKKTIGAEPVEQIPPDSQKEPVTDPGTDEPVIATPFQPSYCQNAQYRFADQILSLDFDKTSNVSFSEDTHPHSGNSQVHVAGQVHVRRLDAGGNPRLVLEIATNDEDILLDVYADERAQIMKVSVPRKYESTHSGDGPCVEMRATIWVPEDADLRQLSLRVVHLDILTLDDLSLHVQEFAQMSSVVGDIKSGVDRRLSYSESRFAPPNAPDFTYVPARDSYVFDSRVIEVSSTSGDIKGDWPLYDMLGLHTTSGIIDVSVTPKAELETDPKAAVLSMSTISGNINVTEPVTVLDKIPRRDYLVDIKSTSGSIHGAVAFGAGVELRSISSEIALILLPVMNMAKVSPTSPAQLETTTTSGTTAVRILEPVWFPSEPPPDKTLDCLQALHKSTGGDIGLQYPQAWEGTLRASTMSGTLKVGGKDVKIIRSVGGFPGSNLEASKGNGTGSSIEVTALMGNMKAVIGSES